MTHTGQILVEHPGSLEKEQPAYYSILYGGKQYKLEIHLVVVPQGEVGARTDPDEVHRPILQDFIDSLGGALRAGRIRWRDRYDRK